ncbi:MAG: family 20 glycosylhydrolase [Planctomycetota bacterium]
MVRCVVVATLLASLLAAQDLTLLPWPRKVEAESALLPLRVEAIACPPKLRGCADAIAETLTRTTGRSVTVAPEGSIVLALDDALAADAYALRIDDQVRIAGGSPHGVALGAATVVQIAVAIHDRITLPCVSIEDAPELPYRGVLLDVARFRHDIALLRTVVALCWLNKVGALHLHLSDDQSFTFPSRSLPKLASIDRDGSRRQYTHDELRELVAYADARGVIVVPEIDVPGHSAVMARAYPELFGHGVRGMCEPAALAALDGLFGELVETFATSPYLHFGADEVGGDREDYCRFVAKMAEIVRARGRHPMVWEGFPGTGTSTSPIARDLTVMAWSLDTNPPDRLSAAGYGVVNCGWWPLYIVPTQNRAPTARDILAWHPRRFENLAGTEPVAVFDAKQPLEGAQLCMWEQTPEVVLPLLRSRLPAFAERCWSPDAARSVEDFETRAAALDERVLARAIPQAVATRDTREPMYRYRFFAAPPRHAWDSMPDLAALAPSHEGLLGAATPERVRAINDAMFEKIEAFGHIDTRVPDGWNPFALELRGRLRIAHAGPHEFLLRTGDGLADLSIDGVRAAWSIRPGGDQPDVTHGELGAGLHEFTLRYLCRDIRNELNLRVRLPGAAQPVAFESLVVPLATADEARAPAPQVFASARTPPLPSLTTGCAVRCSGGTEGAMLPMLAVDGDPDNASGWHAHPWPQWLEVDLGAERAIDRVRVTTYHDGRRAYRFTVRGSTDREHWAMLADHGTNTTPATEDGIEDRFASTVVRFLRVDMLANSANVGVHLSEISAWSDGAAPAPERRDDGDFVVSGSQRELALPADQELRSLRFAADLSVASRVTSAGLRLLPGARIVDERSEKVLNQQVDAPLLLLGDATFGNDNTWTHEAHMLRFAEPLSGKGTLHIEGAGDGGVELRADSRAGFTGEVHIDCGMLIPRSPGALGSGTSAIVMHGGKLFLPGLDLDRALRVDGAAMLWLGGASTLRGDLDVVSGTLTLDTGGGNAANMTGVLRGAGALVVRGGGRSAAPIVLGGEQANTLRGAVTVDRGALVLAKTDGVEAIGGDLVLGGEEAVRVELRADEQIADAARITSLGKGAEIVCAGHRETFGVLALKGDAWIVCGEGRDDIRCTSIEVDAATPDTQLLIQDFDPKTDHVVIRDAAHVERVGFVDPRGSAPGTYRAARGSGGALRVGAAVKPAASLPFAIDARSDAERAKLWDEDGLALLCAKDTPLRQGDVIDLFGDSITWLHGFAGRIESALIRGECTGRLHVAVRNRGINGGGVRELRDGSNNAARAHGLPGGAGDDPQAPFAAVLAEDHPAVAVILIGINDVNWRGTTEKQFDEALRTLCRQAKQAGVRVVLATLMLSGEFPDGSNEKDASIDRYADITRTVAHDEGAVLVDLRAVVIAWLRNHNRELRLDGTLRFRRTGLLTYDGIHLGDAGNDLVASQLAAGITRALRARR